MYNRFSVVVHLLFIHNNQILLLHRFNTSQEDGIYSVPACHIESNESATEAGIREAYQEVGVILKPMDIEVVHTMHRKSEEERIDLFLIVKLWTNEITNRESYKFDYLSWHPIQSLPINVVPYVRKGLENYQNGIIFSELGW